VKSFILTALLALGLFSNELYYYKSGKRIYIDSINVKRDSKFLQFTRNNKAITIPNSFIVKPKDSIALNEINQRAKLIDKVGDLYLFESNSSIDAIELANRLFEENLTYFSSPNFIQEKELKSISDGYYYSNSWHLDSIHQKDVTHLSKGEGVRVAVYDSGIETTHRELKFNYLFGFNFDDLTYDVSPKARSGDRVEYHGSAVAGILLASEDGIGVVGVAPKSYLISIKNIISSDFLTIKAFEFAKEQNIDIINCSWGTYSVSDSVAYAIDDFVKNARGGKGGFVIFAVGNNGKGQEFWADDESALDSVIGVGSTNRNNLKSNFSNYGDKLDIVAPGGEYISNGNPNNDGLTTLDLIGDDGLNSGDYNLDSEKSIIGTSFSSPIVAGVIANMLSINPTLSRYDVLDILYSTAQKVGKESYQKRGDYSFNESYGYGLIDSKKAIERAYESSYIKELQNGWNLVANVGSKAINTKELSGDIAIYRDSKWVLNPQYIESKEAFWINSNGLNSIKFTDTALFVEPDITNRWQLFGAVKNMRIDINKYINLVFRDGIYIVDSEIIYKGEGFWVKER
jgi:subtilisin family serine protease